MEVILMSFVILTTVVWFFGTIMANWLLKAFEENSDRAIEQRQPNTRGGIYPARQWPEPRRGQSLRPSSASRSRLSIDRHQAASARTRVA